MPLFISMITNLENERWLPIQDYEEFYEISNCGRVKSLARTWKGARGSLFSKEETILGFGTQRGGYLHVTLSIDKKKIYPRVHILVAKHFVANDDPVNKIWVNHKNSIVTCNYDWNLEWCTPSYNAVHGFLFGNRKPQAGIMHGNAKYTEQDILRIRELYASGLYTQKEIAELFEDKQNNISRIILRQRWQHI